MFHLTFIPFLAFAALILSTNTAVAQFASDITSELTTKTTTVSLPACTQYSTRPNGQLVEACITETVTQATDVVTSVEASVPESSSTLPFPTTEGSAPSSHSTTTTIQTSPSTAVAMSSSTSLTTMTTSSAIDAPTALSDPRGSTSITFGGPTSSSIPYNGPPGPRPTAADTGLTRSYPVSTESQTSWSIASTSESFSGASAPWTSTTSISANTDVPTTSSSSVPSSSQSHSLGNVVSMGIPTAHEPVTLTLRPTATGAPSGYTLTTSYADAPLWHNSSSSLGESTAGPAKSFLTAGQSFPSFIAPSISHIDEAPPRTALTSRIISQIADGQLQVLTASDAVPSAPFPSDSAVPLPEGIFDPLPKAAATTSKPRGVPLSPPSVAPFLPSGFPLALPTAHTFSLTGSLPVYSPYGTGSAGPTIPHPYLLSSGNWSNTATPTSTSVLEPTTLQTVTRSIE